MAAANCHKACADRVPAAIANPSGTWDTMKQDKTTKSLRGLRSDGAAASPPSALSSKRKVKAATKSKGGATTSVDSLREAVFGSIPAATWSLVRQVDTQTSYADIVAQFAAAGAGVDSRGAAQALQRACAEQGLESWCYEFGDPDGFTHMAVIAREGRNLRLHDPYLNLFSPGDLFDLVAPGSAASLMGGKGSRPYLIDPLLEDPDALKLFKAAKVERGTLVQAPGGETLLRAISPTYRIVEQQLGGRGLAALLGKPIALLDPAGSGAELEKRLGLGQNASEPIAAPGLLVAPVGGSSGRMAQEQLGLLLEQAAGERSALLDRLLDAQGRSALLTAELAAASAERQALQNESAATAAALATAVEERSAFLERLMSEQEHGAALATELAVAQAKVEFAEIRCSDLAERLVQAVQSGDKAIGEADQLRRALAVAERERQDAAEEASRSTARLTQMKAEVDDAQEEKRKLITALAVAEAAQAELKSQLDEVLSALEASELARHESEKARVPAEEPAEDGAVPKFDERPSRSLHALLTPGGKAKVQNDGAIAMSGPGKGCLCYGPYIDLPAGAYRLELDLRRPAALGLLPAHAMIEIVDGSRYLFSSKCRLGPGSNSLAFDFEVPETTHSRQVEFRVIAGSRAFAALTDMRLVG